MILLCGIAIISTSCEKEPTVNPEVENGTMTVGNKTVNITTANAVNYDQKNAIVLTSKAMTAADNEGIAVIFDGKIVPGTYQMSDSQAGNPRVVGLKNFSMGELQFVFDADSNFFGDVYYWISGELSITENHGSYTVVLSKCTASNVNHANISLSVNFNDVLQPFIIHKDNMFVIDGFVSPIGLAGITSIGGMNSIGEYAGVHSMLLMSADHKRSFIVSFVGNETVDGEYQLGYLFTPYLPILPCVHVATDFDFWTLTPQTGYVAKSGTLKIVTNEDGTKTVTMRNLKLKNVEHDNEFFFPILDAELTYHGMMYEIGQ
ncbi:MAG: hypothetical protein IKP91_11190 [Bacteroidaceae bacterium]|nr:hypothetical protein [Bacteroidaceae bacterium]